MGVGFLAIFGLLVEVGSDCAGGGEFFFDPFCCWFEITEAVVVEVSAVVAGGGDDIDGSGEAGT